ncbi:hypothetical protein R5R35_008711 [Gryllus longicercus]|uniref:Uncharacterized protein n=1 Tax=Gryllus longicercus TaxID=2509291 RepID=A0AAN9V8L7_9ORTH
MQTEEVNPEALDEIPILNPLSNIEMTVKEEIEHPVELAEKTNVLLNECMSTESTSQFSALDEHHHSFEDSTIGHRYNSPIDNIRQIHIPLPRDRILNSTHESSAPNSTLAQSIAPTTISSTSQQKTEKERGRGKRRSRWKLKFHHQALPPEYLDHYEAQQAAAAAAAAAATKPANTKADSRNKGNSASKSSSSLTTKSPTVDKTDKLMLPSTQCFIKIEKETPKFDVASSSSSGNNSVMDHLHILPIQALSISDDNDSNSKIQDEISIINEKSSLLCGKSTLSNERFVSGKGLLGSLLTSTITSEISNRNTNENERKRKSVIMSTSSGNSANATISRPPTPTNNSNTNNKSRNYQDLPYMGEITLDNMKPRRGRKPKKADICHLIYKNYGTTVFPGSTMQNNITENEEWSKRKAPETSQTMTSLPPLNVPEIRLKQESFTEPSLKCKPFESLKQSPPVSHSDVQNRIISSLLEKRLMTSQEGKKSTYGNSCFSSNTSEFERNVDITVNNHDSWTENGKRAMNISDEPLNLCVKDLNQLKIRLLRKHGNFYEPRANDIIIKSEPPSPSNNQETDICETHHDSTTKVIDENDSIETVRSQMNPLLHRNENENNSEPFTFHQSDSSQTTTRTPTHLPEEPGSTNNSALPGGYIYWPSAGVFVHPMALQSQFLYYQKMGAIPLVPLSSAEPQAFMPSHVPHVNLIPHINSALPQSPPIVAPKLVQKKDLKASANKTLIPKAFSMMMDTSPKATTSIPSSEIPFPRLKRLAPLGNPPSSTAPTKRKRSAIFIPPMPSENSTNPTTEVSICKFKFTGGAKPSLQEKKMLSVDSGGNFRYYSGTGDKSMRGYEFFPRETLQQSGTSGGTSAEQFLAASTVGNSEKIVGNTAVSFIPDENKPLHLQHLTGISENPSKVDTVSISPDTENGVGSSSSHFDQQSQSGCVQKKTDFLTKGRNASVSGDSEQFASGGREDDPNSQVRIRRKRKTRKSLAREKLEQTFKEKGFLIQTQQLESAEGATYCKFRQLRKFTRYLFRSWKDYLPGNVREMSVAAGVAGPETSPSSEVGQPESEIEGELSCSNSPTPSVQNISESVKSFSSI